MAPSVTEIAYITLKPGVDISGSSDAAKAWKENLVVIEKQEGYQRSSYGRAIESPELLMWFIDWESKASHIAFTKTPTYATFVQNLTPYMDSVHFHHVPFSPFPPTILTSAPMIEFATFYDTVPTFLSQVEKFMNAIGKPEGCYGGAWGDSVESDVGKHADGSVKGKATVLVIEWESKEAHMAFRETETFAKHIGGLREGVKGVEMFHVPFTAAK